MAGLKSRSCGAWLFVFQPNRSGAMMIKMRACLLSVLLTGRTWVDTNTNKVVQLFEVIVTGRADSLLGGANFHPIEPIQVRAAVTARF